MKSTSLFKWTVALLSVPAILLLVLAGLIVFIMLGGGWAYAGAAGCHFVLNPFGGAMVAGFGLGLFALLYFAGQRARRFPGQNTRLH